MLLLLSSALAQSGGDYELTWSTIDGGGGRSTGGDYVLVGTIGQPDAGEMSGGDYTLSGGFWPGGLEALLQCFVNFKHFAQFAMYWLDTPCDVGNNFCEGADLDYLGDVDLEDVKVLAYYWLSTCPPDWPFADDWLPSVGDSLNVDLMIDNFWMYQNLPGTTASTLTVNVSIMDDPCDNSSYTYDGELVLPDDVSVAPTTVTGGGIGDAFWTFASPACDQPEGLSDLGGAFTVKVTVTGDNFGNSGTAEAKFGIALLGDVNNDCVVNVADRGIINAFWRTGSAGSFTLKDCNLNSDDSVNVADRSIANAVWRGQLGQNSVSSPCPLR